LGFYQISRLEAGNLRYHFIFNPFQIKYELKLLSQFCFNLNIGFELEQVYAIEKMRASQNISKNQNSLPVANSIKSVGPLELSFTARIGGVAGPPLKEDIRDILIKHNLFSWDL
jgi:hypothetical protein